MTKYFSGSRSFFWFCVALCFSLMLTGVSQQSGPQVSWSMIPIDTRATTNYNIKQVLSPAVAGTPMLLMSNNGPGTITLFHFSFIGATNQWTLPCATLSIDIDGQVNTCQLWSFLYQWGDPWGFRNGVVDCYIGYQRSQMTGNRVEQVNFFSNCMVTIAFPSNQAAVTVYSDINYLVGAPVHTGIFSHWHCAEAQAMVAPMGTLSAFSVTNGPGQVHSVGWFALSTNNQSYLETEPSFLFNGTTTVPMANGGEDVGGSGFYANNGSEVIWSPNWGIACDTWLQALYGLTAGFTWCTNFAAGAHGSMIYRNFSGWTFPSSDSVGGWGFQTTASLWVTNVYSSVNYTSNLTFVTWTTQN